MIGSNENMKFAELAQIVYDDYVKTELKYQSQQMYKNSYNNYLIKAFGQTPIVQIRNYEIQQLINKLNKSFKPNTVRNHISVMHRTLDLAVKWGFIGSNPCKDLSLPKREKKTNESIATIEDINKLFDIYLKEENLMHKVAFYLAIGCGLRNSEIRALTLDDIDMKNRTINVNKQIGQYRDDDGNVQNGAISTKTSGSIRKIYAPGFVIDSLKEYISSLPYLPLSKYIFFNILTNKPITKHCLSKRFRRIVMDNNLPILRFHDLRHLQATLLIHSGVNIQSASKRLGHSSSRTTLDVYTHSLDHEDKKAVNALENYLSAQK